MHPHRDKKVMAVIFQRVNDLYLSFTKAYIKIRKKYLFSPFIIVSN
jgi:hypothetical protein